MHIKRRAFNVLLGGTSLSLIFPTISKGDNYTGPVNWAGISFLLPFNQIEKLMPVTKVASEINSDIDKATFFNSRLNQSLTKSPISYSLFCTHFISIKYKKSFILFILLLNYYLITTLTY